MSRNKQTYVFPVHLLMTAMSALLWCAGEARPTAHEEPARGAANGEGQVSPLLPGGIADPAGRTGFLVDEKEAIEAVDLGGQGVR
jgi:hypothetical protein